ncbi:MAG: hypothetical protein GEU98_20840 [Pseudonocardiaceae bacterium]|nr:hypothetical protein [Pseudonocardiaceae bacterium]
MSRGEWAEIPAPRSARHKLPVPAMGWRAVYLATASLGGPPWLCQNGTVAGEPMPDPIDITIWVPILPDGFPKPQAEWVRFGDILDVYPQ